MTIAKIKRKKNAEFGCSLKLTVKKNQILIRYQMSAIIISVPYFFVLKSILSNFGPVYLAFDTLEKRQHSL